MRNFTAIVMAAGHGTRMKSTLSKVLHPLCGRPLVYYPVRAALDAGAEHVVVVVNPQTRADIERELSRHVPAELFSTQIQEVPRGTGDAVRAGLQGLSLKPDAPVLVLSGDVPLLRSTDLIPLLQQLEQQHAVLAFMTFQLDDPSGYGRVLRDEAGEPAEIREHKDLQSDEQRAITEVNAGVYAARFGAVTQALSSLDSNNAQGEFYLTDIVEKMKQKGAVRTARADAEALAGVNDRSQLRSVERIMFERIAKRWGRDGVSIVGTPLIDDTVAIAPDARIENGVRLRGSSRIGARTLVDVGTVIEDSSVGRDAVVKPYCSLTEAQVANGVQLGPFAHLRPGSVLEDECHIGNFVETKKTIVRKGAKANHLTYLGDADVGEKSNIGAGTIVCNYNGFQKQRTVIGKGVFVGSDSQLVAPVELGDRAYVATNTTVTKNVPEGALAIGRCKQENKEGYGDALRKRFSAAAAREKKEE